MAAQPRHREQREQGQLGQLRNRQLAHAVLASFVAGFIGLPCLHNLAHQRDHSHGPDGHSIHWFEAEPAHADAPGAHHAPPLAAAGTTLDHPAPPAHGPGGAAHFAVGILATPPFLLPPPPAEAVVSAPALAPDQPAARFSHAVARPRGPPPVV